MNAIEHRLDLSAALDFILAGKATFTIRSLRTQCRFTYRVTLSRDRKLWFVKCREGAAYLYIGIINEQRTFRTTAKAQMSATSLQVAGITWLVQRLASGNLPEGVEFWHAGQCGRCGRALTDPESIAAGFGPECIQRLGRKAA